MRILFLHQNFPGQFRHLAPALAAHGHDVLALSVNRPSAALPGVKVLMYRPQATPSQAGTAEDAALLELRNKMARGEAVARVLEGLKKQGYTPDLVYAHSGWGEAFFVKDFFPAARMLVYAEYYFQREGGDMNFDPEFTSPESESSQLLQLIQVLPLSPPPPPGVAAAAGGHGGFVFLLLATPAPVPAADCCFLLPFLAIFALLAAASCSF